MPRGFSVEILGVADVVKALEKVGLDTKAALEAIVIAGAEVVQEAASENAPERTGTLKSNIIIETLELDEESAVVGVGPDRDKAWYAHFVELGTGPKQVKPEQAQALELEGGDLYARANPSGTAAQPFMRPAVDDNKEKIQGAGGQVVKGIIK